MEMISKTARKYIEKALREKIAKKRPNFPFTEQVVSASMENIRDGISRGVLYRAIELAHEDKNK